MKGPLTEAPIALCLAGSSNRVDQAVILLIAKGVSGAKVEPPRAAHEDTPSDFYVAQLQSLALARQPPEGSPVQARPRTNRPVGDPVGVPLLSAKRPFTRTSLTPVDS